jgi:hypothetical protein
MLRKSSYSGTNSPATCWRFCCATLFVDLCVAFSSCSAVCGSPSLSSNCNNCMLRFRFDTFTVACGSVGCLNFNLGGEQTLS